MYIYMYIYIYISCITLRTLNFGNYGMCLILGNAGFMSSTVCHGVLSFGKDPD